MLSPNLRHPGAEFTMKQVKDREQRLKQDHNVVKSILEKSGFGWDPEKGVPIAPDEKWMSYLKSSRSGDTKHSHNMMFSTKYMMVCSHNDAKFKKGDVTQPHL
jgi:hypothetical protein